MGACAGCQQGKRRIANDHSRKADELFVFNKRRCRVKMKLPMRRWEAKALSKEEPYQHKLTFKVSPKLIKSQVPLPVPIKADKAKGACPEPNGCWEILSSSVPYAQNGSAMSMEASPTQLCAIGIDDDVESGFYDGSNNENRNSSSSHRSGISANSVIQDRTNIPKKQWTPSKNRTKASDSPEVKSEMEEDNRENYCLYEWPTPDKQSLKCAENINQQLSTIYGHLLPSSACLMPARPPLSNWNVNMIGVQLHSFQQFLLPKSKASKVSINTRACKTCTMQRKTGQDVSEVTCFSIYDEKTNEHLSALTIYTQFQEFLMAKFTLDIVNELLCKDMQIRNTGERISTCRFVHQCEDNMMLCALDIPSTWDAMQKCLSLVTASERDSKPLLVQSYTAYMSVPLSGWPVDYCEEFFIRSRKWPSKETIKYIRVHCPHLRPAITDEWIFLFNYCEDALFQSLLDCQKQIYQLVMMAFQASISSMDKFYQSIINNILLRYFEISVPDLSLKGFAKFFRDHIRKTTILHYIDSSLNLLRSVSAEQWKSLNRLMDKLFSLSRGGSVACQITPITQPGSSIPPSTLSYIIQFNDEFSRLLATNDKIALNSATMEMMNHNLVLRGCKLAQSLGVYFDAFDRGQEENASVVYSYIPQIGLQSVPIVYHRLWRSYVHYMLPFLIYVLQHHDAN